MQIWWDHVIRGITSNFRVVSYNVGSSSNARRKVLITLTVMFASSFSAMRKLVRLIPAFSTTTSSLGNPSNCFTNCFTESFFQFQLPDFKHPEPLGAFFGLGFGRLTLFHRPHCQNLLAPRRTKCCVASNSRSLLLSVTMTVYPATIGRGDWSGREELKAHNFVDEIHFWDDSGRLSEVFFLFFSFSLFLYPFSIWSIWPYT